MRRSTPHSRGQLLGLAHPAARAGARGAPFAALACAAALTGGCTGSLNTSNQLVDAEPLPALAPAVIGPQIDDGPSLNGLDRRNWPMTTISVPRGQVEHQPIYWSEVLPDQTLARQRGERPHGGDVLDGTGDPGAQAVEASANLAWTPLLLPLSPIEMIVENRWPWTTVVDHPTYERIRPASDRRDPWIWITPPAPDAPAVGVPSATVPPAPAGTKPSG
ncbi:MAG: hypothetical protein U0575_12130 [Phycisphaerales bacterium]